MLENIMKLFGYKPTDYADLMNRGATIVDVRTKGEFSGGHIRGSINIPLDKLDAELKKLKKDKPVITCCASGMRSSSAKGMLQSKGFEVVNGGSWHGLQEKLFKLNQ